MTSMIEYQDYEIQKLIAEFTAEGMPVTALENPNAFSEIRQRVNMYSIDFDGKPNMRQAVKDYLNGVSVDAYYEGLQQTNTEVTPLCLRLEGVFRTYMPDSARVQYILDILTDTVTMMENNPDYDAQIALLVTGVQTFDDAICFISHQTKYFEANLQDVQNIIELLAAKAPNSIGAKAVRWIPRELERRAATKAVEYKK